MENKQSSIEWLLQRFEDGDMYNVEDAKFIKHQAKTMEKEQIVDAIDYCRDKYIDSENYYNETYGK
jgi:hypothetical protein